MDSPYLESFFKGAMTYVCAHILHTEVFQPLSANSKQAQRPIFRLEKKVFLSPRPKTATSRADENTIQKVLFLFFFTHVSRALNTGHADVKRA